MMKDIVGSVSLDKVMQRKKEIPMIKAGIIGSTGYAGQELVRLLLGHKDV